jgi:hypothetical protein
VETKTKSLALCDNDLWEVVCDPTPHQHAIVVLERGWVEGTRWRPEGGVDRRRTRIWRTAWAARCLRVKVGEGEGEGWGEGEVSTRRFIIEGWVWVRVG